MELIETKYKQTEVGLIPEVWEVTSLGDCCLKITDGTHDTPKQVKAGIPFLTAIHVKENNIDYKGCYYLPENVHRIIYNRCNPEINDVLMVNIGAGVATTALVEVDYEFSLKNVALLKPNKSILIGSFLNYWQIQSKAKIINTISTGGAQPFLSLNQIGNLKIALPTIIEQKAIASALSDIDALIANLEQLIIKKKAIKQGAMQQLLTPPHKGGKRLPGFTGEWTEKLLKSLLSESPKYGIGASAIDFNSNYFTYLRITDIDNVGRLIKTGLKSVNHPDSAKYILKEGELVFARTGASVGKSYLYNQNDGVLVYAGFLIKIKPDVSLLNPEFLKESVSTDRYWNWVRVNSMRSGQPGINSNEFGDFTIDLPSTLEEQKAIAEVLREMDTEIELLQFKKSKYEAIKQGMMQELLTGKTRLVQ